MLQKIIIISGILLYFLVLINLIKKNKIYLKYALLWLLLGILLLIFAIFPQFMASFMIMMGISNPLNGLFGFLFLYLLIFIICLLATVSRLNTNSKKLIQTVALLEKRIEKLEKNDKKSSSRNG